MVDLGGRLTVVEHSATRATLLARLRDGDDPAAWQEFHQRYYELIGNVARRWGLQPADCDDVVQETLSRLVRSMASFEYDPEKGRFRAYLKTAVSRVVLTKLRQMKRAPGVQPLESVPELSAEEMDIAWESEWRRHHVRIAMRRIHSEFSPLDIEAFERYAVKGESVESVRESLQMSADRVYQAKSRIMKRLSVLIDEQIAEEEP